MLRNAAHEAVKELVSWPGMRPMDWCMLGLGIWNDSRCGYKTAQERQWSGGLPAPHHVPGLGLARIGFPHHRQFCLADPIVGAPLEWKRV